MQTIDMLVRLYDLPDAAPGLARLETRGIRIRRPEARERTVLLDWVRSTFSAAWADECATAFARQPPACFVAVDGGPPPALVGFACHDCTRRNFFGPAGVAERVRGIGIGASLTLATLAAMRDAGYAYAIIGGVGPAAFYAKIAGATPIEGSTPGVYRAALRGDGD